MRNSIEKTIKNESISNEMRKFFLEFGLNIDQMFEETNLDEILTEEVTDGDIRQIINLVKSIEGSNNAHKILFAAGLLEIRSQITKNHEQIADTKRQLERSFKDVSYQIDNMNRESSVKLNSLYYKLNNLEKLLASKVK